MITLYSAVIDPSLSIISLIVAMSVEVLTAHMQFTIIKVKEYEVRY